MDGKNNRQQHSRSLKRSPARSPRRSLSSQRLSLAD